MDTNVRPIFKKLLLIALTIFVIGVGVALTDIYYKVGTIEHLLVHIPMPH